MYAYQFSLLVFVIAITFVKLVLVIIKHHVFDKLFSGLLSAGLVFSLALVVLGLAITKARWSEGCLTCGCLLHAVTDVSHCPKLILQGAGKHHQALGVTVLILARYLPKTSTLPCVSWVALVLVSGLLSFAAKSEKARDACRLVAMGLVQLIDTLLLSLVIKAHWRPVDVLRANTSRRVLIVSGAIFSCAPAFAIVCAARHWMTGLNSVIVSSPPYGASLPDLYRSCLLQLLLVVLSSWSILLYRSDSADSVVRRNCKHSRAS